MTAEQLIIGNQYVPFQKTIGDDFSSSKFVVQNLDFLYYIGTNNDGKHMFSKNASAITGAYYNPEDVYEYIEEYNGIQKGMAVVITDSGETYSSYRDIFKQLLFKDKERNDSWDNGIEGVVFGITKTSEGVVVFAVRRSSGRECLIGADSVCLLDDVEETKPTKWAIKVNPYNKQALVDWRGFAIGSTESYLLCDIPEGAFHNLPNNRGYSVQNLIDYTEYTLITDEQFYNLIINKPQTMPQTPQETKQYPKTPQGLYDMHLDMLDLKIGDVVKVTHKVPDLYMGWSNDWASEMDNMVGKEYIVERIADDRKGIQLKETYCSFPPYVLEFIKHEVKTHSYCISDNAMVTMEEGSDVINISKPIEYLTGNDVMWLVHLLKDAKVNDRYSVYANASLV
jgi:hypothetical protein